MARVKAIALPGPSRPASKLRRVYKAIPTSGVHNLLKMKTPGYDLYVRPQYPEEE